MAKKNVNLRVPSPNKKLRKDDKGMKIVVENIDPHFESLPAEKRL
jgi:hypothetical protein